MESEYHFFPTVPSPCPISAVHLAALLPYHTEYRSYLFGNFEMPGTFLFLCMVLIRGRVKLYEIKEGAGVAEDLCLSWFCFLHAWATCRASVEERSDTRMQYRRKGLYISYRDSFLILVLRL